MAATFTVDICNLAGTVVWANIPKQSWKFDYGLGEPGAFEAEIWIGRTGFNRAVVDPGAHIIKVYRNGTYVWGGYLWGARVSRKSQMVTLRGRGFSSRLARRIIWQDQVKTDVDTADIAWQLINFTQTTDGTLGILDGHVNSGFVVDRAYCYTDKPRVLDSIVELSEMDNSFDFWITPTIGDSGDRFFKTAVPRRGSVKAVTLDGTNLLEDDYEIDADDLANRIWGTGAGDCNPPDVDLQANASIAKYGQLHDTADFDDLDHLSSVEAHTREDLRNSKVPREQGTIYLQENDYTWGSFDVGDIVTVVRGPGYNSGSVQMRVLTFEATFDPGDKLAFYAVTVDSVIGAGAA